MNVRHLIGCVTFVSGLVLNLCAATQDLASALGVPGLECSTGGNAEWVSTGDAVQSGRVSGQQSQNWMEIVVEGPAVVSFDWAIKVPDAVVRSYEAKLKKVAELEAYYQENGIQYHLWGFNQEWTECGLVLLEGENSLIPPMHADGARGFGLGTVTRIEVQLGSGSHRLRWLFHEWRMKGAESCVFPEGELIGKPVFLDKYGIAYGEVKNLEIVPLEDPLTGGTGEAKVGGVATDDHENWTLVERADAKAGSTCLRGGMTEVYDTIGDVTEYSAKVRGEGNLSFWWKPSCEEDPAGDYTWDHAEFWVDDECVALCDGESDWQEVSLDIKGEGDHILTWRYVTDGYEPESEGCEECVFIDGLTWSGAAFVDEPDPIVYRIAYQGNGGEGAMEPTVCTNGLAVVVASNAFQRTGYAFVGWALSAEGAVAYRPGDEVVDLSETTGTVIDFYAKWEYLPLVNPEITTSCGEIFTTDSCVVAIVCESADAVIYYSTNGRTPGTTEAFRYKGAFAIAATTTVKAVAVRGEEKSEYVSKTFTKVDPVVPTIVGDDTAFVFGDETNGFIVKPSAGVQDVIVKIPSGIAPEKVTVEVSSGVRQIQPNGAVVKVFRGLTDITDSLDIPSAIDGVINLSAAKVKGAIVSGILDVAKGAKIVLDAANPSLTTAPTHPGMLYVFREGTSLGSLSLSSYMIGDGRPWTPEVSVKGGASGFYSIEVSSTIDEHKDDPEFCDVFQRRFAKDIEDALAVRVGITNELAYLNKVITNVPQTIAACEAASNTLAEVKTALKTAQGERAALIETRDLYIALTEDREATIAQLAEEVKIAQDALNDAKTNGITTVTNDIATLDVKIKKLAKQLKNLQEILDELVAERDYLNELLANCVDAAQRQAILNRLAELNDELDEDGEVLTKGEITLVQEEVYAIEYLIEKYTTTRTDVEQTWIDDGDGYLKPYEEALAEAEAALKKALELDVSSQMVEEAIAAVKAKNTEITALKKAVSDAETALTDAEIAVDDAAATLEAYELFDAAGNLVTGERAVAMDIASRNASLEAVEADIVNVATILNYETTLSVTGFLSVGLLNDIIARAEKTRTGVTNELATLNKLIDNYYLAQDKLAAAEQEYYISEEEKRLRKEQEELCKREIAKLTALLEVYQSLESDEESTIAQLTADVAAKEEALAEAVKNGDDPKPYEDALALAQELLTRANEFVDMGEEDRDNVIVKTRAEIEKRFALDDEPPVWKEQVMDQNYIPPEELVKLAEAELAEAKAALDAYTLVDDEGCVIRGEPAVLKAIASLKARLARLERIIVPAKALLKMFNK